eukprot:CAMPEP_0201723028 /NCGR_PEP_ID=MMETSP0593-20130828/7204_1 /ASSEMBLY_ACC=CAM_ASM_000672 /TAXON_ID=267983 /ORGANISM="Skeletonema japonicum, Strain CCMP2506" /LENGTH=342 /DNA_ID=CAMNT_0048214063 /DNA_START=119 /DNA_END=1147 /DNA_ORIENTATION=+
MTSTLSRFSNAKLAAVGGSIVISVGALTTLAVMGGIELHSNRVAAAALRNTDAPTSEPSDVPSTEPSNVPSDQPSLRPSSSPTVTTSPSLQPTLSSSPSAVPSVSPSLSLAPTLSAQPSSNPSAIPSLMPSSQPSASPTISTAPSFTPTATPTNKPTPKPTPIRLPSSFRLRMHWERGDFWQDESWEKWYCMACAKCNDNIFDQNCDVVNYCRNGMMLALTECRPNRGTDAAKFSLLPGNNKYDLEGDQLQLADRNLCLSLVSARKVKLETCNPYKVEQRFTGFKSESDGAMEIAPVKVAKKDGVVVERCLTQHHHPRQGERLYVEICKLARISDTNLWSVY